MKRPTGINASIGIGIFAIFAFSAYWYAWFLAPDVVQARVPGDPDYAVYVGYEEAFILPDAFVTIATLVGIVGLWKMRDWGFLSTLLAAGGAIFLGLEDLLFDLQHAMFVPLNQAGAIELIIVLMLMSLGPVLVLLLWRHRREFIR